MRIGFRKYSWRTRRAYLAALLASFCLLPAATQAQSSAELRDAEVRLGFAYNFAKFATWPAKADPATSSPMQFCITAGDAALSRALLRLNGNLVHGRPLLARTLPPNGEGVKDCHVLYLSASNAEENTAAILEQLVGLPVLTVSEREGFMRRGGMMELSFVDQRYQFSVNYAAAKRAGLSLQSGLLRLARSVQ